jgi:hypothetical protein
MRIFTQFRLLHQNGFLIRCAHQHDGQTKLQLLRA